MHVKNHDWNNLIYGIIRCSVWSCADRYDLCWFILHRKWGRDREWEWERGREMAGLKSAGPAITYRFLLNYFQCKTCNVALRTTDLEYFNQILTTARAHHSHAMSEILPKNHWSFKSYRQSTARVSILKFMWKITIPCLLILNCFQCTTFNAALSSH